MDANFASELAAWHEFFAAVAGIAATLVGLLFVALGLNPRIMGDAGPAGMRTLAGMTFHSFLIVLVIALIALIPGESGEAIVITLLIVGAQGVWRVVSDLRRWRASPDPLFSRREMWVDMLFPALAYAICLWVAFRIWNGDSDALGWLVAVVFLLLMSAAANSWDLLKAIGEQGKGE
jgi:hypothetical protein